MNRLGGFDVVPANRISVVLPGLQFNMPTCILFQMYVPHAKRGRRQRQPRSHQLVIAIEICGHSMLSSPYTCPVVTVAVELSTCTLTEGFRHEILQLFTNSSQCIHVSIRLQPELLSFYLYLLSRQSGFVYVKEVKQPREKLYIWIIFLRCSICSHCSPLNFNFIGHVFTVNKWRAVLATVFTYMYAC